MAGGTGSRKPRDDVLAVQARQRVGRNRPTLFRVHAGTRSTPPAEPAGAESEGRDQRDASDSTPSGSMIMSVPKA